jgi:hypothetical protein
MANLQAERIQAMGEEGFIFLLQHCPTTPEDCATVQWALTHQVTPVDPDPSHMDGGFLVEFELPYEQGYGYTKIFRAPLTPRWEDEPSTEEELRDFTGWWLEYGYTDSMTNIFVTPIFDTHHTQDFYTWEY